MQAQFGRDIRHLALCQIRRVGDDQIEPPLGRAEPVRLRDLRACLHPVQHRIGAGLQTGSFGQIKAQAACILLFGQKRHQNTARSRAQIKHPFKGLGQRQFNKGFGLGPRIQHIAADLEVAPVKRPLPHQMRDRHAHRPQGDQLFVAFGNIRRDFLGRDQRHPRRID